MRVCQRHRWMLLVAQATAYLVELSKAIALGHTKSRAITKRHAGTKDKRWMMENRMVINAWMMDVCSRDWICESHFHSSQEVLWKFENDQLGKILNKTSASVTHGDNHVCLRSVVCVLLHVHSWKHGRCPRDVWTRHECSNIHQLTVDYNSQYTPSILTLPCQLIGFYLLPSVLSAWLYCRRSSRRLFARRRRASSCLGYRSSFFAHLA